MTGASRRLIPLVLVLLAAGATAPAADAAGARCPHAIRGTAGADTLRGTIGGDRMFGLSGNDHIEGSRGGDCLYGGPGRDVIYGEAPEAFYEYYGNDVISGGDGDDELHGGDEYDFGRGDRDRISGGRGRDEIVGGAGADVIDGGPGNDTISGEDGVTTDFREAAATRGDVLRGGSGNDTISGDAGHNVIDAGTGNDEIDVANGLRDIVGCGAGRDRVRADAVDRLTGCEQVRRLVSPFPTVTPRGDGGRFTRFLLRFRATSPFDISAEDEHYEVTVDQPRRCRDVEVVGSDDTVDIDDVITIALRPPTGGWCRGRHTVSIRDVTVSQDTEEECPTDPEAGSSQCQDVPTGTETRESRFVGATRFTVG